MLPIRQLKRKVRWEPPFVTTNGLIENPRRHAINRRKKPACFCDVTHGVSVDRIVSRNGQGADAVRHDDMTAVPYDGETGFLQRSDRGLLIAS